ncbi:MAG: cytochrome c peroxidase [Fuerstiella sp.]
MTFARVTEFDQANHWCFDMSTSLGQMMQFGNNLTASRQTAPRQTRDVWSNCGPLLTLTLTFFVIAITTKSLSADDQVWDVAVVFQDDTCPIEQTADDPIARRTVLDASKQLDSRRLKLPAKLSGGNIHDLPPHFNNLPEEYRAIADSAKVGDAAARLGLVLFYDRSLSGSGQVACASCHRQQFAFSDVRRFSVGHDGRKTSRQSMSLINLRYSLNQSFFWDERAAGLRQQVLIPIENDVEMGHSLKDLVVQLQADPIYPPLFAAAFGSAEVNQHRMASALSQFVLSIVSYRSAYDVGMAQVDSVLDDFPNFTDQQNLGKRQFFESGCASCHLSEGRTAGHDVSAETPDFDRNRPVFQTAIFQIEKAVVNGIDSDDSKNDAGVGAVTNVAADVGAFRSPSLRNVEVTGPYMHDGRFKTLDRVVEHYNWSVQPHPNLDRRLHFAVEGMAIPELQKVALVEFLKTLTDHALLNDPSFADPFVRLE